MEGESESNLGSWTVGDDADFGELGLRVVVVIVRQASGCGPFFHVAAALSWLVPTKGKGNNTFVRIPRQPRTHTPQGPRSEGRGE